MKAGDIKDRKFEKSFSGYRMDEVNSFLSEVSEEYANLAKENKALEKKLEVLADKIREYRDDEAALKDAILSAQKQGQKTIAAAKENAREIIEAAKAEREKILAQLTEEKAKLLAARDMINQETKEKAERIIYDATEHAKSIERDLKLQIEIQKDTLYRTKTDVDDFRNKIISELKNIERQLVNVPLRTENESIKKALSEFSEQKRNKAEIIDNSTDTPGNNSASDIVHEQTTSFIVDLNTKPDDDLPVFVQGEYAIDDTVPKTNSDIKK